MSGSAIPEIIGDEELSQLFAEVIKEINVVVVYRCAPSQKAETVKLVQKHKLLGNPITVAIGDGSNDVNMISQASVGFGI